MNDNTKVIQDLKRRIDEAKELVRALEEEADRNPVRSFVPENCSVYLVYVNFTPAGAVYPHAVYVDDSGKCWPTGGSYRTHRNYATWERMYDDRWSGAHSIAVSRQTTACREASWQR